MEKAKTYVIMIAGILLVFVSLLSFLLQPERPMGCTSSMNLWDFIIVDLSPLLAMVVGLVCIITALFMEWR